MNKKLKVGVIGVGSIGQHHARVYSELPGVVLIGVADVDAKRAEEVAQRFGAAPFTDYHLLIPYVDAVSVAVPTKKHLAVARDCLKRRLHLLVEKPLAASVAEAKQMLALATQHKRILTVGHIERFNPVIPVLLKRLNREKVLAIEAHRLAPFAPRATDVSVVFDLMLHDIDLALKIAKSSVKKIFAVGRRVFAKTLDYAAAQLVFKNGVIANLTASKLVQRRVRELTVSTKEVYFEANLLERALTAHYGSLAQYSPEAKQLIIKGDARTEQIPLMPAEPLAAELEDFTGACLNQKLPQVQAEEGLTVLEIAEKVEKLALRNKG